MPKALLQLELDTDTHPQQLKKANKVINDRRATTKKTQAGRAPPAAANLPAAAMNPAGAGAEQISSKPRRAAPGAPQPAQTPHRVQTGRVAKAKQRGKAVSQEAAVKLENPLFRQVPGPTLPSRVTRASSRRAEQQALVAGAGPRPANNLVAPAPGPSGLARVGQGGQVTVEEILQTPLDDTGRDKTYQEVIKDLLRSMGASRRRRE
jgi:hypothetical protein